MNWLVGFWTEFSSCGALWRFGMRHLWTVYHPASTFGCWTRTRRLQSDTSITWTTHQRSRLAHRRKSNISFFFWAVFVSKYHCFRIWLEAADFYTYVAPLRYLPSSERTSNVIPNAILTAVTIIPNWRQLRESPVFSFFQARQRFSQNEYKVEFETLCRFHPFWRVNFEAFAPLVTHDDFSAQVFCLPSLMVLTSLRARPFHSGIIFLARYRRLFQANAGR